MKKIDVKTKKLFDLEETIAKSLFEKYTYPWEVFKELGSFIEEIGATLPDTEYLKIGKNIWVHRSVKIMPTIALAGPLIIGKDASIRSCAFFRGNVIIGEGAVAGNSCEFKNAILFNKAQVPHFSYVGDSIIGYKAHLGASAITSIRPVSSGRISGESATNRISYIVILIIFFGALTTTLSGSRSKKNFSISRYIK